MKLIGIHDGHNASIAFMEDDVVKFALQEERLVRVKNAGGFPIQAMERGFSELGWDIKDIEQFIFAGKDRGLHQTDDLSLILKKYDSFFSPYSRHHANMWDKNASGKLSFVQSVKKTLKGKSGNKNVAKLPSEIEYWKTGDYDNTQLKRLQPLLDQGVDISKIAFLEHHLCHASAAAYGFEATDRRLVITSDSYGDELSGTVSVLENGKLTRKHNIHHKNSLGRLYSLITYYLGLVPLEHEYKIMGMSPFAIDTKFAREIADMFHGLFEYQEDGFNFQLVDPHTSTKNLAPWLFEQLRFRRFDHISAGIQLFLEEFVTDWISRLVKEYKCSELSAAGGLFMNVKLNQRIRELDGVNTINVFPSCGDETNVFGALYYAYNQKTNKLPEPLKSFYFGTSISEEDVLDGLRRIDCDKHNLVYEKFDNIEEKVAELISQNEVVARCKGPMEFGARALGNRSIVAPANSATAVTNINKMIKKRDFWMPFAPSVVDSHKYVQDKEGQFSPFMMQTFTAKPEHENDMIAVCQQYDKTCRVQDVTEEYNPDYYKLIKHYEKLTGFSVIMNTSFNLHGFPIVTNSFEALEVLVNSGLNYLAVGNYLVSKK